jgi:hypothetical protein
MAALTGIDGTSSVTLATVGCSFGINPTSRQRTVRPIPVSRSGWTWSRASRTAAFNRDAGGDFRSSPGIGEARGGQPAILTPPYPPRSPSSEPLSQVILFRNMSMLAIVWADTEAGARRIEGHWPNADQEALRHGTVISHGAGRPFGTRYLERSCVLASASW